MARRALRGIWAAVVTPIDAALHPDSQLALPYYRELLERGCDGLNLLGTTGEAMSFGLDARIAFMRTVATSGLPMERLMVGTGAAALEDAVALTRTAFELGFSAALVMPPFFFRDASDDGVVLFYEALFARVAVPGRVVLYNFPAMSGMTFAPPLVAELVLRFGNRIAGVKDSSNDRALQRALIAAEPGVAIFPGSEGYLRAALEDGAAGCISGSVALWPELAQAAYRDPRGDRVQELTQRRDALAQPIIASVRQAIARQRDEPRWLRSMPPLTGPACATVPEAAPANPSSAR